MRYNKYEYAVIPERKVKKNTSSSPYTHECTAGVSIALVLYKKNVRIKYHLSPFAVYAGYRPQFRIDIHRLTLIHIFLPRSFPLHRLWNRLSPRNTFESSPSHSPQHRCHILTLRIRSSSRPFCIGNFCFVFKHTSDGIKTL